MPKRLLAHRIRLYPDAEQQSLLRRTFGCCRLLYNLALEQRSTFWRPGRRITFASWSSELKALKAEAPFLKEVPHHCLVQSLVDLDSAFTRFFNGDAGYPKPRRKFDNEACRFPDPLQFDVLKDALDLPKLGRVRANIHRPIQGKPRSVTITREGSHWYASVLVMVHAAAVKPRPMAEGGYDVGVAQPVVESDGTVHVLPRRRSGETKRGKRLQQTIARCRRGSKRRDKARMALRRLEAKATRRRRDAAHQVSHRLTQKYTHLAAEYLKLKNMTASAKGTVEDPGRNVAQKAGLNRAILDIAPGRLRRLCEYKAGWRGGVFVCVDPARTSQTCSECERHPADSAETAHLPHGRVSRDLFVCPLCGYTADADVNAARNIRARGRRIWAAGPEAISLQKKTAPRSKRLKRAAAGPAVSARGVLSKGREAQALSVQEDCEPGTKIWKLQARSPVSLMPSGPPQAA